MQFDWSILNLMSEILEFERTKIERKLLIATEVAYGTWPNRVIYIKLADNLLRARPV